MLGECYGGIAGFSRWPPPAAWPRYPREASQVPRVMLGGLPRFADGYRDLPYQADGAPGVIGGRLRRAKQMPRV